MLETTNLILVALVIIASLTMVFSKQVYAMILFLGRINKTHDGIKIMRSRNYIDVETGEQFTKWTTVRGLRADAIAAVTRF